MENCGPGYGTDINVPVYATVKGVSVLNLIPHRYHSSLARHRQGVGASLTYSSSLITINDHGPLVLTVKGVGTS